MQDQWIDKEVLKYRITERLGQGGMGIVYKAVDERLNRNVALKVLPNHLQQNSQAIQRFTQEARAASALDHPNICTIHEIDKTDEGNWVICMAHYNGKTLKSMIKDGPLPEEEALNIAIQIGNGLAKAHEKGLIHRDIKPGNIMVLEDGSVKIIDFGLAKLANTTDLTKTGTSPGTVSYMSPEQIEGSSVDQRTDVWALCVLLYEMLTGKKPFEGKHDAGIIYSVLNTKTEAPSRINQHINKEFDKLIEKGLSKSLEERYTGANELLTDLHHLQQKNRIRGKNISRTKKLFALAALAIMAAFIFIWQNNTLPQTILAENASIALLPVTGLSEAKGKEAWTVGFPNELLLNLKRINNLRVLSMHSTLHYAQKDLSITEIANLLDVEYLLAGFVNKNGNSISVSLELMDGETGEVRWAEKFSESITNILSLQSEAALGIAEQLVTLTPGQRKALSRNTTVNVEAYDLYLRGKANLARRNNKTLPKAITFFEESIFEDSTYAPAYVGLAQVYYWASFGYLKHPPANSTEIIAKYAERAFSLDSTLADAHAVMGISRLRQKNIPEAERFLKQALTITPDNTFALETMAVMDVVRRDFDLARERMQKALAVEPSSATLMTELGWVYYFQRQFEEALKIFQKALSMQPDLSLAQFNIGLAHEGLKEYDKAIDAYKKAVALTDGGVQWKGHLGRAYALMGKSKLADEILQELLFSYKQGYGVEHQIGAVYMGMKEFDKMLEWWRRGHENGGGVAFLSEDAGFDILRDYPELMQQLKDEGLIH